MPNIEHDLQQHHFSISSDACADPAILEYRMLEDNLIDFYRTFVPPALRNHGLAEKLVRHGLKWANEQGYDIQGSCWYVDKFLRK